LNEYLFGVVFTDGRQQPITASVLKMATTIMNAKACSP